MYVPVAPSGEHHAPGYTRDAPLDGATVVVVVDWTTPPVVVDVVGVIDVVVGVPATVVVVELGVVGETLGEAGLAPDGRAGHGAIVSDEHDDASRFFTRPHSLWSIDNPHRAFTAIQLPRYVHRYDFSGGNQLLGSLSLFDWFTRSVTASNVRESDVSLAYARRIADDQAHAPESHASFKATTWSMSIREGSDQRAPS